MLREMRDGKTNNKWMNVGIICAINIVYLQNEKLYVHPYNIYSRYVKCGWARVSTLSCSTKSCNYADWVSLFVQTYLWAVMMTILLRLYIAVIWDILPCPLSIYLIEVQIKLWNETHVSSNNSNNLYHHRVKTPHLYKMCSLQNANGNGFINLQYTMLLLIVCKFLCWSSKLFIIFVIFLTLLEAGIYSGKMKWVMHTMKEDTAQQPYPRLT